MNKKRRCIEIIQNKKIILVGVILLIGIGGYNAFHWWDTAYKKKPAETTPLKQEEDMPAFGQVDYVEEDISATDQGDDIEEDKSAFGQVDYVEEDISATDQGDDIEEDKSASDSVDYVDEELYAEIKDICKNIDFRASFNAGDVTKYDLYKEKFKKFINGEATVWIKETGEELYIYDVYDLGEFRTAIELGKYDIDGCRYYFFDINGDENPELCIQNRVGYIYVFQYNEERDQIVLWKEYISNTIFLMGTQKLGFAGGWSGDGMIRVDENGDRVFFVRFKVVGGKPYSNDMGDYGYLVFLPEYIELREDMLEQAIYDETDEQYCFRVTEEQFEELTKDYNEAVKDRDAALDAVTYTYTELFD